MSDRVPHNLQALYDSFSREAIDGILSGDEFTVDGVEFVCRYKPESTSQRFYIAKPLVLVDRYRRIMEEISGGTIMELGIAEGGSTALFALLGHPAKLVAVDLEPLALDALGEFVDERGLGDVVRAYYGVDQSDRDRLVEITANEFGGEGIDLVVDDASHQLDPTRASFEALFPLLREGGRYMIEDWRADHKMRDAIVRAMREASKRGDTEQLRAFRSEVAAKEPEHEKQRRPLSQLAVELVLARASLGEDAVASVSVDDFCIVVTRGSEPLDPRTFRLSDRYNDYFGFLPGSG